MNLPPKKKAQLDGSLQDQARGIAAKKFSHYYEIMDTKETVNLSPLPQRDNAKPSEQQGVFKKFKVQRTDGESNPGGKHFGCEYFVLDVDHDQHAKAALAAYADSVERTHPYLAADMRIRYGLSQVQRDAVVAAVQIPPDATREEWKDAAWKMWKTVREHNHSIPSHWIDAMRIAIIAAAPGSE